MTRRVFVTSDTHFGHSNIIRYCNRPFANANEMDKGMIARWNERVKSDDIVFHLGDFAFSNEQRILEIMDQLVFGELFIVPGNHDQTLLNMIDRLPPEVTVLNDLHSFREDGKMFVLCHFPMEEWNKSHHGSIHLHGHTHNNSGHHKTAKIPRRYDVGVDMYGGPTLLTGDCRYLDNPKGWQ